MTDDERLIIELRASGYPMPCARSPRLQSTESWAAEHRDHGAKTVERIDHPDRPLCKVRCPCGASLGTFLDEWEGTDDGNTLHSA